MRFDWKKALKICLCVFGVFLCVTYWHPFVTFVKAVFSASSPLLLGLFVAFFVNIIMTRYEKWFFPKKQGRVINAVRRPLCMVLAFLTIAAALALIVWLIVPQLLSCIQIMISFLGKTPDYIKDFIEKAQNWDFIPSKVLDSLGAIDWESRIGQFVSFVSSGVGDVVNTVAKTVMGIFSGIVTGVLGLIFSVYLLLGKDKLKRQFGSLAENYLPEKIHTRLFYLLQVLNESFRRFIVGQVTEAVILGVLCTLGMLIFGFPFATMVGALIGFTALIPVAGAYIGAITGALMILTVSPAKAIAFLVFILILQQLEGNIIYPRVVGSSIGLPGIWVLVAVTVGGGCFGVPGMLIGVPLFSTLYRIIREDLARRRGDVEACEDCAEKGETDEEGLEIGEKIEKTED